MQATRVMVFGGCNVRGPIVRAIRPQHRSPDSVWDEVPDGLAMSGVPFMSYTLGEMMQTISCYQGDRKIPDHLLPLCNIKPQLAPAPHNSPLSRSDVILLEPNTSMEIEFDGYHLNRAPVLRILIPIRRAHPSARKLCMRWYNKGIVGMDADARRDVGEELALLLPMDTPDRDLCVDILRHANGRRCDVDRTLGEILDSVTLPVGIVLYTWAYMPDGRGISWPATFAREVKLAAGHYGLPIFDPRPLVERTGTDDALKLDLRHYAETFMPVVAKPLVEFAIATAQLGRSEASRPGRFNGSDSAAAA